jgi:hypothetical protein
VCECNFFDTKVAGHLDYGTLKENLPRLTAKDIVITHMGDKMLARLPEIDLEAAADGTVVRV